MKHTFPNNCLAAHLGGGSRGQGGAQQGTRARGEQYLDGVSRSHTLAAEQLFGITNTNNPSAPSPFFRSKPTGISRTRTRTRTRTRRRGSIVGQQINSESSGGP